MAGRNYSDAFRSNTLAVYRSVGLNEAARRCGVDKKTVLNWARDAGIEPEEVSRQVSERNARATAALNAKIARDRAEARERVLTRVIKVSEAAATRELELLVAGGFTREDLQALTNARQKAIAQFELLEGRATSRSENLVEADAILGGVVKAFAAVLELAGPELRERMSEAFALELRRVREQGLAALEAGDVEDGELVDGAEEAA